MFQITFNRSGDVSIVAIPTAGGACVSATAPINQLADLLPAAIFDAVRARAAAFVAATEPAAALPSGGAK